MRHVLKTPAKSASLSSGIASVATATWYDIPTPIIVHSREFREEAERDAKNDDARKESCENEMMGIRFIEENTRVWSSKGPRLEDSNASYRSSRAEADSDSLQVESSERTRDGKRHSTTMELNATTTVKTDADGVPTISFSFLRTDDNFRENDDEIVILEVDTSDQVDSSGNQLYDLPKSASLESNRVSLERSGHDKEINLNELPIVRHQDLYDVPKSTREKEVCNLEQENYQATNTIISPEKKGQQREQQRMKRSTRSLKSGRRSYGASDSDGYDAGIASMSGSYSDPEACPNEEVPLSESDGSDRSKRLRLQKRRLGKAWGRMRSWLREERTRIGQVVNRHAKLQAVGALSPEVLCRKEKERDLS